MEKVDISSNIPGQISNQKFESHYSKEKIEFEELIKAYRLINVPNFNMYLKDLWKVSSIIIIINLPRLCQKEVIDRCLELIQ
jgi:hypothetical protein